MMEFQIIVDLIKKTAAIIVIYQGILTLILGLLIINKKCDKQ